MLPTCRTGALLAPRLQPPGQMPQSLCDFPESHCPGRSARLPQWAERQGGPSAPADLPCIWDRSLHLSPGEEGGGGGGQRSRAAREDGQPRPGRTLPEPPARSVSDINECRRYPGRLCGHKCENTPGSYYCSCTMGFRLSSDGRSCEGEGRPWAGVGTAGPASAPFPDCPLPRRSPGRPTWERLPRAPTRIR